MELELLQSNDQRKVYKMNNKYIIKIYYTTSDEPLILRSLAKCKSDSLAYAVEVPVPVKQYI